MIQGGKGRRLLVSSSKRIGSLLHRCNNHNGRCMLTTTAPTKKNVTIGEIKNKPKESINFFRAGLPLLLFSGLGVWVVSNGIEGKYKEMDAYHGSMSKSERQAKLDKEHDDMMDKLNEIVKKDFDNTKRIERPEEILARRRKEREARNVWYRRWGRWIIGKE